MKQFHFLIIIFVFVLTMNACNTTPGKIEHANSTRLDVVLTKDELFDGNKVFEFLQNEQINSSDAKESFLKGLDLFKNKKDHQGAINAFVNSIVEEPTGLAYYELGNAYMEKKDYEQALKSYGMAEQVGYEPFSKILYNMACVYSLMDNTDMAGQYLEYAIQAGYSNIDQIQKDSDLTLLRNDRYTFEHHLKNGLNGVSNAENLFWLQFKKQFSKTQLPVTLDPFIDKKNIEDLQDISYDFEKYIAEMRDEKFSREVSKGFYYYMNVKETDNYVALVYLMKDYYFGELAPVTYRLVTFTHDGVLIDKKEIAGRESLLDELRVASIDKNLNVKIDYFDIKYKKDTDEFGFDDNPIVSRKLNKTVKYTISKDGKIKSPIAESVAAN